MRIALILLLGFVSLFQDTEAADTLLIKRTVKQLLNESGLPYNYRVIKQQFYNSDGSLFREINYSDSDGEMLDYMFVFYKNGKILTEEFYTASDSLKYIVHYSYNKDGNVGIRTEFTPSDNGKLSITKKEIKSYKNGQTTLIKRYKGKRIESITRLSYDSQKKVLQENTAWKSNMQSTKQEAKVYDYNTAGQLVSIKTTATRYDGTSDFYLMTYSYDDNGRKTSVKEVNSTGGQLSEETYTYNKRGDVSQFEQYNAEGKRIQMLQYQYLKNSMEKGVQISRYEGL